MHTVAQYGYAISMIFALLALLGATLLSIYAGVKLLLAVSAIVETPDGTLTIGKEDINVNWSFIGVFVLASVLWLGIAQLIRLAL